MQYLLFARIFWPNGSFFSRDDYNILKEEVKTYLMAQSLPLDLTIIFFICASIVTLVGYSWGPLYRFLIHCIYPSPVVSPSLHSRGVPVPPSSWSVPRVRRLRTFFPVSLSWTFGESSWAPALHCSSARNSCCTLATYKRRVCFPSVRMWKESC
jgi:hypothetical protein